MNKQDLEEFLTISYDKLAAMGACETGLNWFAEHFGINDEWPLGDVAEELRYDYYTFLDWYLCEYRGKTVKRLKDVWIGWEEKYYICDQMLDSAYLHAQYFATYYKIRELEELL